MVKCEIANKTGTFILAPLQLKFTLTIISCCRPHTYCALDGKLLRERVQLSREGNWSKADCRTGSSWLGTIRRAILIATRLLILSILITDFRTLDRSCQVGPSTAVHVMNTHQQTVVHHVEVGEKL